MAEIHILDSSTIDKIAAGEVVERPASVVKELVENAIDAGSSAITVEIKDGGTSMIRVTDNGCGIEKTELKKAFMRHATSKIETAEDLSSIHSLGFRGEALSSISAVSMVEMITKTEEALTGVKINVDGAVLKGIEEIGAPNGTTMVVRNLFFNTPARRKFLKSSATEGSYVSELMEHLALSRADISFTYRVNGQLRFHTPGNNKLKDVIYMLYGREISQELIAVEETNMAYHLYGYLGKPSINRGNRNFETFFVNGRYIKSNIISKAIEEGGRGYYMQHKFPFCVLMLELSPELMDVNVHPTKLEVRFSNQNQLFDFIMDTVRLALRSNELIPEVTIGPAVKETTQNAKLSVPEPFEETRMHKELYEKQKAMASGFLSKDPKAIAPVRSEKETGSGTENRTENNTENKTGSGKNYSNAKAFFKGSAQKEFLNEPEHTEQELATQSLKSLAILSGQDDLSVPKDKIVASNKTTDTLMFSIDFDKQADASSRNHADADDHANADIRANADEQTFVRLTKDNVETLSAATKRQNVLKETQIKAQEEQLSYIQEGKAQQMALFDERTMQEYNRKNFKLLGQIFDTYWLFSYDGCLYIMDQHAAHEKCNFERMMKKLQNKEVTSQQVNPPQIITVSARERETLEQYQTYFEDLGFELESFGGNEIALRAIPQDLYGCDELTFFRELLDEMNENEIKGNPQVIYDKIASMSCKAAVKGNNSLSMEEASALISELLTLENPYHCPHGRPTLIKMTQYELDRKFKRIL